MKTPLVPSQLTAKGTKENINMNVSDEAKLFAVRAKLLQAERQIYEANKILANIGGESVMETTTFQHTVNNSNTVKRDPVTGLYPGQIPSTEFVCELPKGEVECVE